MHLKRIQNLCIKTICEEMENVLIFETLRLALKYTHVLISFYILHLDESY